MPVPPDFALRLASDNGSLPLEDQHAVVLTLDASGGGTIEERHADERGAPAPIWIGPDALAALHAEVVALGLFSTVWAMPAEPVTPGGPSVWISASGEGAEVRIPPVVRGAQREAHAAIVGRVEAAVGRPLRV